MQISEASLTTGSGKTEPYKNSLFLFLFKDIPQGEAKNLDMSNL